MSTLTESVASALLQRIQQRVSSVECVWASHNRWPLPLSNKHLPSRLLRISVLDSSFNPPTLAHLALANARPLPASSSIAAASSSENMNDQRNPIADFDARLLLLSVRNADKSLKPWDATLVQRLEMMVLLAEHVHPCEGGSANTAVAIVDEPTFVGKSRVLRRWLSDRLARLSEDLGPTIAVPKPQLTFIVGLDTLERLLAPRYYRTEEAMMTALRAFLSPTGDDSFVVCARRVVAGSQILSDEQQEREQATMAAAKEFLESGRIGLIDIGVDEQTFSSSEVRDKVARGDSSWQNMIPRNIANYLITHKLYEHVM